MPPMISEAINWWQAGYTPLPVKPDGSKAPAVSSWTAYQKVRPTLPETLELFKTDSDGIGLICGAISGGLEMLELEGRAVEEGFEDKLSAALHAHDLDDLWIRVCNGYVELTPKGGVHYYYRVEGHPKRNTKLAQRPATPEELEEKPDEKKKTLIETRAEGGFTVIAPSSGRTHTDGVYKVLVGGIQGIPWVTEDERDAIHAIASTLDQMPVMEPPPPSRGNLSVAGELRPGDDYNARASWKEILEPHGWTIHKHYGGNLYGWRKPNKSHPGISATTGRNDADRLYVFSTSTIFESERPYSKFGGYALLNHGGDYAAAARELRKQGYGAADPNPKDPHPGNVRDLPILDGSTALNPAPNSETNGHRQLVLTPAHTIKPKRVHWLWEGRIAIATLALLAGREGQGKSTLAYWIVAQITLGLLPGEHFEKPKSVLVCATEDSWEHTIVPRLIAAGADLTKVFRIEVISESIHHELTLPKDLPAVTKAAQETDASLLLLDPLMSRIDDKIDTHRDAETRRALEPLVATANHANIAILGLIHHNKSGSTDPLQLVMASKAFTAVARSVHTVVADPDDETEQRRLFGTPKNNLGRIDLPTLAFTIQSFTVPTDEGDNHTAHIVWTGESLTTITEAMRRSHDPEQNSATQEAANWLDDYLTHQGGNAASADIKRAGAAAGHSVDALKRARKRMGCEIEESGFPRRTYWLHPSESKAQT